MTEAVTPPQLKSDALDQAVVSLVQTMGQSLNMAILYGVAHKVASNALERSYPVVMAFIEKYDHIHFNINEGVLLINGISTGGAPLAIPFASRLSALNLLSFTLEPGFSFEEYSSLFALLMTPPAKISGSGKSASELIESIGLKHVQATSFTYRRVAMGAQGTEPAVFQTAPSPTPTPEANPNAPPDVQNIMAFLKNDPDADTTRSAADIRQLANDSEKLAQLILRTVEIRSSQVSLAEGESLNELVVGCIRKVVDQITQDPALRTQKGRKQVKRSLLMLETSLLERLQIMAGETVARDAKTVISEVAEDLDLDTLAGTYMKSRRASAKAKDKLSGLIDRVKDDPAQLEELHEKLAQEGLSAEGWRELTLRQQQDNPSHPSGGMGEGPHEIKLLTLLLARLGDAITPPIGSPDPAPETIKTLVSETETHLAKLTQVTENNIHLLHKKLERETSATSLSRHEIFRILAEIAQEISQPLTIITGAITLIRSLRVGPLTATQGELLSMISESGKRMEQLIRSLSGLAGTPDALEPDQAILSAAYRVKENEPIRRT